MALRRARRACAGRRAARGIRRGPRSARRHPVRRAESRSVVVLGIDPGLANLGFGVVAAPAGTARRARRRRHQDLGRRRRPSAGCTTCRRASARCSPSTSREAVALEALYFGQNVRTAFAVGQARGAVLAAAGSARRAVLRLHAAAGQGRRLRQRPRRQGPGDPHGPGAALAARRAARRSRRRRARRRRSATPTTRRCAAARRTRALASARDDRARRRRGRRAPRRSRRARDLGRRRLPPRRLGRDAASRCPRSAAASRCTRHLVVRDDALSLYGFATEEERDLFLLLLGVQGVGPKVALGVLSGGPPRELVSALAAGDVARLQAVPGVGKRTAERIVVELREKVVPDGGGEPAFVVTRGDDPRRTRARRPASSSASRRPRPTRCSAGRGRERRGAAPERAAGGAPMTDEPRIHTPQPGAARRGRARALAAAAPARRVHRPGGGARAARRLAPGRGRRAASRSTTCCSRGRPGLGKTSLAQIVAAEIGRARSCRPRARRSSARATSPRC